jgi:hypothetical protein
MQTFNLKQAAKFLNMHEKTLQSKAKAGEVPGAKPGKCWVFIDIDLANWLRGQYNVTGEQDASSNEKEKQPCSLKEKAHPISTSNLRLVEKQYTDLLGPKTGKKPKK